MAAGNGMYTAPDTQPPVPPSGYQDMTPNVITVNLGIKMRHIVAGFTMLGGVAASGGIAGYLFIPAKAEDVKTLEVRVKTIDDKVDILQNASVKLTEAVQQLTLGVQTLADRRPVVALPARR